MIDQGLPGSALRPGPKRDRSGVVRSASRALIVIAVIAALPACGSSNQPDALVVDAKSGARVDLSGTTWASCADDAPVAGHSVLQREVVSSKGSVAFTATEYASPGCTGTVVAQAPKTSAIVQAIGDRAVTFIPATPAGVTPPVTASAVQVDLGSALALDCYWLDDSVTPRVLYVGAPSSLIDQNGFPTQLSSTGLVQQ